MRITFIGAARHVTGSCTMIECAGKRILIDCGMPQGSDEKKMGDDLMFRASGVDAVLLTHAHIDHSGWLPLLGKEGFTGDIWCTSATADLSDIMLADSGHIQEMEAEWKERKSKRRGGPEIEPIYTARDAAEVMKYFKSAEYGEVIECGPGIKFRFVDAGHLLGSAMVEVWLEEDGEKRKFVFSGDVGNTDQPLIKDPQPIDEADYVLIESTYGDRIHRRSGRAGNQGIESMVRARELASIVTETFLRGGNVIIPAFAVGRTQEMLYLFRLIIKNDLCPELGKRIPVFVDSPLSVKATGVFAGNIEGYFDSEAMALVKSGVNPLSFPTLVTVTDAEDSKQLNFRKEPCVIISSSGMCDAGRIRHHLKHNLWRRDSTLVFSGYQAEGTLGRSIRNGARHVTLFGEQVSVNCEVRSLEGISGHADRDGLDAWISSFRKKPRMVFVNHGEEESALAYAYHLTKKFGLKAYAPKLLDSFNLLDEASFPSCDVIDETKLPHRRELSLAVAELLREKQNFDAVFTRILEASRKSLEPKDAIRLTDAASRLASDLEFMAMKWNRDGQ